MTIWIVYLQRKPNMSKIDVGFIFVSKQFIWLCCFDYYTTKLHYLTTKILFIIHILHLKVRNKVEIQLKKHILGVHNYSKDFKLVSRFSSSRLGIQGH